ncbi:hypothetical protein ACOME3_002559 [Neoechinorhynchus agilis]
MINDIVNEQTAASFQVRDVIVRLTYHHEVRKAVLQGSAQTLDEVMNIAMTYETTKKALDLMTTENIDSNVDKMKFRGMRYTTGGQLNGGACSRCSGRYTNSGESITSKS